MAKNTGRANRCERGLESIRASAKSLEEIMNTSMNMPVNYTDPHKRKVKRVTFSFRPETAAILENVAKGMPQKGADGKKTKTVSEWVEAAIRQAVASPKP